MGGRLRAAACSLVTAGLALSETSYADDLFVFEAPHHVRSPSASMAPALASAIDDRARTANLTDASGLLAFALRETSGALHFGLSHKTRLSFDRQEREGNCVEYAELFASIVNRERGTTGARAWVVRSDAKVMGWAVPDPAWKDHDWVLVVTGSGADAKRSFVDPTLYDMGLGWDIAGDVRGVPQVPAVR